MTGLLKNALLILAVFCVAANAGRVRTPSGETVCMCTLNYDPICATDGITYGNMCSFECARDEAAELGRAAISVRANQEC